MYTSSTPSKPCHWNHDAGQLTSQPYSDYEVLKLGYDGYAHLTGAVTTPSGSSTAINLVTNIGYSGTAGAAGLPICASYDPVLRPVTRTWR